MTNFPACAFVSRRSSYYWVSIVNNLPLIRHDPYAGDNEAVDPTQQAGAAQKAQQVLELARQQNLTDGADRNDFARKLYLGLKGGKKQRHAPEVLPNDKNNNDNKESDEDSSSEEEYVTQRVEKKRKESRKKRKEKKRRKKKRRRRDDYSSSDDDSSSDGDRRRKRKRKRRRDDTSSSSSSSSSSSVESSDYKERRRRRRRKEGKRKRDDRRKLSSKDRDSKRKDRDTKPFIASKGFTGSTKGYIFRNGEEGVGYYQDKQPTVNKEELKEMLRWARD